MIDARAEEWARRRSFHHSLYPPRRIARERTRSVSVCLPARECAGTVGEIVVALARLREQGAIDEIVVVDAASRDGTAQVAERAGATVVQEADLAGGREPDLAPTHPVLGKGDAMWRSLRVLTGDFVAFIDADSEGFSEHFATGLLGPLVCEPGVSFVKGFYRRPFEHDGVSLPEGGGRVNHLTARPALALFFPELAGVRQPLAGEVAATRALLEQLPFATGYGVEIAMLIDAWRTVGLDGIAQVDLDVHRNRHQSLAALSEMAGTVLATVVARAVAYERVAIEGGFMDMPGAPVERPPLTTLAASAGPVGSGQAVASAGRAGSGQAEVGAKPA